MKQTERVLTYMQKHGSITQREAINELDIYRLSARIWSLKQDGHTITSTLEYSVNAHGEAVRYARYRLKEQAR